MRIRVHLIVRPQEPVERTAEVRPRRPGIAAKPDAHLRPGQSDVSEAQALLQVSRDHLAAALPLRFRFQQVEVHQHVVPRLGHPARRRGNLRQGAGVLERIRQVRAKNQRILEPLGLVHRHDLHRLAIARELQLALIHLRTFLGPRDLLPQPAHRLRRPRSEVARRLEQQVRQVPEIRRPTFAGQRHQREAVGHGDVAVLPIGQQRGKPTGQP